MTKKRSKRVSLPAQKPIGIGNARGETIKKFADTLSVEYKTVRKDIAMSGIVWNYQHTICLIAEPEKAKNLLVEGQLDRITRDRPDQFTNLLHAESDAILKYGEFKLICFSERHIYNYSDIVNAIKILKSGKGKLAVHLFDLTETIEDEDGEHEIESGAAVIQNTDRETIIIGAKYDYDIDDEPATVGALIAAYKAENIAKSTKGSIVDIIGVDDEDDDFRSILGRWSDLE